MAVELWGEPQQPQLDLLLEEVLLPSFDYRTVQQTQQQQQGVACEGAGATSDSQPACLATAQAAEGECGRYGLMFVKFKQLQEHAAAEIAAHHADAAAAAVVSQAVPSTPAVAPASDEDEQQAVAGAVSVHRMGDAAAGSSRIWDRYVALDCAAAGIAAGTFKMQQRQQKQQHAQSLLLLPAALAADLVLAVGDLASTATKTAGGTRQAAAIRDASCSLSAVVAAAVAAAAAASPKRSKRQPAESRVAAVPAVADNSAAHHHQQQQQQGHGQAASERLQDKQCKPDGRQVALPQQHSGNEAARAAAGTTPALQPSSTAEQQLPCDGATDATGTPSQQAQQQSSEQTSSQQLLQLQLSPADFLVEVPVCVPDCAGLNLVDQLLADGLKLAAAVTQLPLEEPAAAAAKAGGLSRTGAVGEVAGLQQGEVLWDASWGDLWQKRQQPQQQQQEAAGSLGAAAAAWWFGLAAQAMLSGSTLKDAASSSDAQQPAAAAAVSGMTGDSSNLGTLMLESLLAADMQLEGGDLLLPVPLLPDDTAAAAFNNSSGSASTFFRQYLQGCGYKRQPTAHLELYFDWSVLQPLLPGDSSGSSSSRCGGGRTGLSTAKAGMQQAVDGGSAAALEQAAKRSRTTTVTVGATAAGDGELAKSGSSSGDGGAYDAAAWLAACRKLPGMQQMQHELLEQQQQQGLQQSQMPAAAAAGVAGGSSRFRQLQLGCCNAVVQEALQLHDAAAGAAAPQVTGGGGSSSNAVSSWGEGSACIVEEVPPEVAAAATAASAAHDKAQQAAALQQSAASGAVATGAHAALAAVNGAAEQQQQQQPVQSDLEFFLQLQGGAAAGGSRAGKRRFTATQVQYKAGKCTAAAAGAGDDAGVAAAVSGGVGHKRPKTADVAAAAAAEHAKLQLGPNQHEAEQQQQQQNDAADLALTGARHDSATDRDQQQQQLLHRQTAKPQVLRVDLQGTPLLQLLLALQANRQALLCNLSHLQCPPGPQLTGCKLWDDAAAQAAVDSCHAAAAAAGPLNAQQKQAAKHFVGLLLLAQSAGCLLHYGVRMAHLFLQHGLQKLPSVAELCSAAAAALKLAHDALEKGAVPPPPAAAALQRADAGSSKGSSSSSSRSVPVDHPKLVCLKALLVKLKAAKTVSYSQSKHRVLSPKACVCNSCCRSPIMQVMHALATSMLQRCQTACRCCCWRQLLVCGRSPPSSTHHTCRTLLLPVAAAVALQGCTVVLVGESRAFFNHHTCRMLLLPLSCRAARCCWCVRAGLSSSITLAACWCCRCSAGLQGAAGL
jgi:hypothetical protein